MANIYISFNVEEDKLFRFLAKGLNAQAFIDAFTHAIEHGVAPEEAATLAQDAQTLTDKEWDAKHDQGAPDAPPEPLQAAPDAPPAKEPEPAPAPAPKRSHKKSAKGNGASTSDPTPETPPPTPDPKPEPNEPATMPSLDTLVSAVVTAVKTNTPPGIKDRLDPLREKIKKKFVADAVEADAPHLWQFVQDNQIDVF